MDKKGTIALAVLISIFAVFVGIELMNRTEITSIKDILANPAEYENTTVTVEGVFGGENQPGWWRRGNIYEISDRNGKIYVYVHPDLQEINERAQESGHYERYEEMIDEELARINSLIGKRVRVTGVFTTYPDRWNEDLSPLIYSTNYDII
jgi:hypothetical protein